MPLSLPIDITVRGLSGPLHKTSDPIDILQDCSESSFCPTFEGPKKIHNKIEESNDNDRTHFEINVRVDLLRNLV